MGAGAGGGGATGQGGQSPAGQPGWVPAAVGQQLRHLVHLDAAQVRQLAGIRKLLQKRLHRRLPLQEARRYFLR